MRKKIAATFCAAALTAAFSLAGCSTAPSDSTDPDANEVATEEAAASYTINLGHLNSTAHVLAFVAEEESFFDEEGVDATLTQFSSSSELVAGLESDNLDVAFIGSVSTLVNQSSGHDISIFGGAMSNGHGVVIDSKYTEGYCDSNLDPDYDATASLKADALDFGYIEEDFDLEEGFNLDIYSNALDRLIESDPENTVYQNLKEHFEQYK